MTQKFVISLLWRAFKMMKDGVSFILIAFAGTELFKFWFMQIRGIVMSLDWHKILQNHKKWNVSEEVLCI